MDINASYVKFGDKETLFVLSPKDKTEKRKISTRTLIVSAITIMVFFGLVTGLVVLSLKNVDLKTQIENFNLNFSQAQNLSHSQIKALAKKLESKNETISFLEMLIEDYEFFNVHFETEYQKEIQDLTHNFTQAKNKTAEMQVLNKKLSNDLKQLTSFLKKLIDSQDKNGETELHKAIKRNNTEEVKILVKLGANPNIKDNVWQGTALDHAAFYGHPEIVQTLLKNGAKKDVKNINGRTPLEEAKYFKKGDYQKVITLLTEN